MVILESSTSPRPEAPVLPGVLFKALARALEAAVRVDPRVTGIPSTKGVL